jgi:hypothetical protein
MSTSYSVTGYVPADNQWTRMKKVRNACVEAGIDIPDEVCKYFDYVDPNTVPGIEVDLECATTKQYPGDSTVYEVDLNKLPRKDIRYIQFTISG